MPFIRQSKGSPDDDLHELMTGDVSALTFGRSALVTSSGNVAASSWLTELSCRSGDEGNMHEGQSFDAEWLQHQKRRGQLSMV